MKLFRLAAALAALTFALAACGGGSSSSSTPTPATGGGSSSGSGGNGTPVNVTLADFSIKVSGGTTLAPGTYTLNVTNNGPSGHNLTIEGPGVNDQATPTFTSGTQQLTVTLKDGSYELLCSVPGHKQAGMDVNLTVGSGGGGATGSMTTGSSGGGSTGSSGGGWG
jgi:plastocyanin